MALIVAASWRQRPASEGTVTHASEAEVREAARSLVRKYPRDVDKQLHRLGVLDTVCGDGKALEKVIVWIEEELTHPDGDAAHLRLAIALNCIYGLAEDASSCEITRYRLYDLCERSYLPRDFLSHRVKIGHGIFDMSGRLLRRTPVGKRAVNERIRLVISMIENHAFEVSRQATLELQDAGNYHQASTKARARARMWAAMEPLRMVYRLHIAASMQNLADSDHYYTHALEIAARDVKSFLRDCRHGGAAAFIDQAADLLSVPHEFPFMGTDVPLEKESTKAVDMTDTR